jgi:hypothetical protein
MSSYFRESRNVELSLLYYLTTCFTADWSGITTLKTFANVYAKDIVIPIVCARLAQTTTSRQEIGADTLYNKYLCIIDIFASSDAQRLDLADYIKDKLKTGWIHYDHSHASGDNTTLVRTANGRDYIVDFINDSKVEIYGSVDNKDKCRHSISISVRKSS